MLYITFVDLLDAKGKVVADSGEMLRWHSTSEWFKDDIIKEMIKDVDNSELLSPYCIQSPVLGQIPPERLSGGVKMLIAMYNIKDPEMQYYATRMGDNCAKWIVEIAKNKDIRILLNHHMEFIGVTDMHAIITNTGKEIHSVKEYDEAVEEYLDEKRQHYKPACVRKKPYGPELTLEYLAELEASLRRKKAEGVKNE